MAVKNVDPKIIKEVLEEFSAFLQGKLDKKGYRSFNSIFEIYWKLQEENY